MQFDVSRLWTYPRPESDTGIGMHLGPNKDYLLGRSEHWGYWLEALKRMNASWGKVLVGDDAGSMQIGEEIPRQSGSAQDILNSRGPIRLLLDSGIMPVARLYRKQPNPGVLSQRHLEIARFLYRIGVRYYEMNNESNLRVEWKDEFIPNNAPPMVAGLWLQDAISIVAFGGYPGITAMAPGGNVDDIEFLSEFLAAIKGKVPSSVLDKMWFACHNYTGNHPLDYPDDSLNRGQKPNGNIMDPGESNCFRKFEALAHLSQETFGRVLPVLSTEGGTVRDTGFLGDPRYPQIMSEAEQATISEEIWRRMMGGKYPRYYFTTMQWVMANRRMENPVDSGFEEGHSWYPVSKSNSNPDCVLAVGAVSKVPRTERDPVPIPDDVVSKVVRNWAWNATGVDMNEETAFFQYAKMHDLGRPLSQEVKPDSVVPVWRQIFERGIPYLSIEDYKNGYWGAIKHASWF